MATLKSYVNGASMGRGNNAPVGGKRGNVNGWTRAAVRRHLAWLWSVDVDELDGDGYGVTLTLRDTPPSHEDWAALVARLHRSFRDAGLTRWHWVVEWQRRGTPHLHLAVYSPPGWESPIMNTVGAWTAATWLRLAEAYAPASVAQAVVPITGAQGWLEYLSKHASRGVGHYQRQGTPAGWTGTGRLWGKGGSWPVVEPLAMVIDDRTMRRMRRLFRSYVVADARSAFLALPPCSGCRRSGRRNVCRTCAALDRWQWARHMLRCPDVGLSAVRGAGAWVPQSVVIQMALNAGWTGELKEVAA